MIVVRVELHSAVTGEITEIARMHISNAGFGTDRTADYFGESYIGRDSEALDRRRISKYGAVYCYRKLDLHVWNLVCRMLGAMGYTK